MLWLILCLLGTMGCLAPKYLRYRRMKRYLQSCPTLDEGVLGGFFAFYRVLTWKPSKDIVRFIQALGYMHWKQGCSVIWILHQPVFIARRPEYAEAIMSGSIRKSSLYDYAKPYLGNGLITSNGELWKKHRKLLNPAFNFRFLSEYIPIMNKQAKTLLNVLSERSRYEAWVDIYPLAERCSLDIICETSMGIDLRSQHGDHPEYLKAINEIMNCFRRGIEQCTLGSMAEFEFEMPSKWNIENSKVETFAISRMLNPLKRPEILFFHTAEGKQCFKYLVMLKSFTEEVFRKRMEEMLRRDCKLCQANESYFMQRISSKPSLKPASVMDILLHFHLHEKLLSEQEVQDEVNTFLGAGFETSALCVTWSFHLLGLHPEVQEKVHEELTSIFASDKERPATNEDIRMMKYLECVIKESLRVRPVVPMIGFSAEKDIPIAQDLVIPNGTECVIPLFSIFSDKKTFPRPEKFIPERFLPEHSQERHAFSYIPFSAGPRNCIGQRYAMNEVKIILSTVLRCFSVKSLDPQDKIVLDKNITLKPKCPIRITFEPR